MNHLCAVAAVMLLIAFSAVNLFLPYALVVFALIIGLAFACGTVKRRTGKECPLGFC